MVCVCVSVLAWGSFLASCLGWSSSSERGWGEGVLKKGDERWKNVVAPFLMPLSWAIRAVRAIRAHKHAQPNFCL